jgi:hypothetical protein
MPARVRRGVCARAGGASLGGVLVSGSSASPFFRLGNCMSSRGNTRRARSARSAARRAPTTVHHNPGATPGRSGREPSGLVNRHDKHVVVSSLMGVPTKISRPRWHLDSEACEPRKRKRASKVPDANTIPPKHTRARSRPRSAACARVARLFNPRVVRAAVNRGPEERVAPSAPADLP